MNENKTNINWYPGHMAKTKREIREKIGLIDIVFEVIDARIPYSSKNRDVDDLIGNKPKVLIMTKVDLCDLNVTNRWKKYYEDKGYSVVLLDLIHNSNLNVIYNAIDGYVKNICDKRRNKGLKSRRVRVLVLGIPNVGKSTLINRLVNKKVANVGNRPGITKSLEWIRINDSLELLDTPGILWPKLDNREVALNLASMTAIREEVLNIEEVAIYIVHVLSSRYPNYLMDRYHLEFIDKDIVTVLDSIGKYIGAVRNGETDYDRVYNVILNDLRDGHLGKVTFDFYED